MDDKPKDEWQIIPNTQPAIIDEDTWKRVQELREHRIRPTATGRTSQFSGKVFCADCGAKLHFCAAKSLNANQEHYRCANCKSGRGSCQIHYNDKSSGRCYVKVDIYFTAIGLIDIPAEDEIKSLMAKIKANPQEYRLTA